MLQVEVNEIFEYYSNQEETDTRVVLYLNYIQTLGCASVVIRTPDTDILMILLLHAHRYSLTIIVDIGYGKNRQKINVSFLAKKMGEKYYSMLTGFYVFTGEDVTSSFEGKGKLGPLKKLKNPCHQEAFRYNFEVYSLFAKTVNRNAHTVSYDANENTEFLSPDQSLAPNEPNTVK